MRPSSLPSRSGPVRSCSERLTPHPLLSLPQHLAQLQRRLGERPRVPNGGADVRCQHCGHRLGQHLFRGERAGLHSGPGRHRRLRGARHHHDPGAPHVLCPRQPQAQQGAGRQVDVGRHPDQRPRRGPEEPVVPLVLLSGAPSRPHPPIPASLPRNSSTAPHRPLSAPPRPSCRPAGSFSSCRSLWSPSSPALPP